MQRARRGALVRPAPSGGRAAVAEWICHKIKAWRTRRALLALSDEQLKDIGLSRSEVYSETLRGCRD